jgi:hypothetical protein
VSLTTVTLRNPNDTYVVATIPAGNYSDRTTILTKSAGTGGEVRSLIWFPKPNIPLGAQVVSATLRLYQAGAEAGSHTVKLQKITALSWLISKVTWANKPTTTATGEVSVTLGAGAAGREWAFDVTAHIQAAVDGGVWSGWTLVSTTDEYLYFHSAQAVDLKPVLEVVWSDAPEAPATMAPSSNRAVSVAKPVLRFNFTDIVGNTALQAVQVQIDAANNFTSGIDFDSGTVVTSSPELDLSTTAYAGLAADASTWWRARVQDAAGVWSDWSASAQFQRKTKGTLAFTNPPVSGLITEPTPPIIWSLTGRTQRAWQVFITPSTDNTLVLHNTGKVSNTDTSYTLPAGVIKDDQSYNVHLRVWDTIDREGTPSDQAYTYTVRTFTYDYDATVAPVTSLAVTDQSPVPAALLTWSRSTAPDSFVVRRNGVVVAANLDPAELSTGGTGYAYTDRGADPNKSVTWSVHAIVNGKTSTPNPTVSTTLRPVGIWLSDPARGIYVQLLDQDEGNWSMGEVATSYMPVGGSRAIRVTQALRGFEGNISGRIMTTSTGTVDAKAAALWDLKETPGRSYVLTLSDLTIPVVIGNLVVQPLPLKEIVKRVAFDFWQVDDLPFRAVL